MKTSILIVCICLIVLFTACLFSAFILSGMISRDEEDN